MTNLKATQALDHVQLGKGRPLKALNPTSFPDTAAPRDVLMRVEALPAGVPVETSLNALRRRVEKDAHGRDVVLFMLSDRDASGRLQVAILWADRLSTQRLPTEEVTLEALSNQGPLRLRGQVVHQVDVQQASDSSFRNGRDLPITAAPQNTFPSIASEAQRNARIGHSVSAADSSVGLPAIDWHQRAMHFPEARAYARAQGTLNGPTAHTMAILDLGVQQSHPGLAPRSGREQKISHNLTDGPANDVEDRINFKTPLHLTGHGTTSLYHVKGVRSGEGPGGVLPEATVGVTKVNDRVVSLTGDTVAEGIRVAIRDGVSVISLPHLVVNDDANLRSALSEAYAKGVVVVAAPGSHILKLEGSLNALSTNPTTIAAGASMPDGSPWELTHGGHRLDVLAPGYSIQGASRDGGKPIITVTEGSTHPTNFVAAAALLWVEHHGAELEKRYPEAWMRAEAFRWCLQMSATPSNLASTELKQQFGSVGILNAEALLKTPLPERDVLFDRRSLIATS